MPMKKIGMLLFAIVIVFSMFIMPTQAIATGANDPIVLGNYFPCRYFVAAVRVPITFVSKVANCNRLLKIIHYQGI